MNIQPLHPNFKIPTKGTDQAGAFDIYMPQAGVLYGHGDFGLKVPLGFAAAVPTGHVALILPRSGVGAKNGLALNNTCGVIDSDYRGEWIATLRVHNLMSIRWEVGDRLLQFLVVPVAQVTLSVVDVLDATSRGTGGFGSTGN